MENKGHTLMDALKEARRHLVWSFHYMKEPESHPVIRQIDAAILRATEGGA